MTQPPRASRRTLLLGAAATVATAAGIGGSSRRSAAAPVPAPGAPVPIEDAAAALLPAKRLRPNGLLMFPMGPEPRCYVLKNFGDPRSGGRSHEGIDLLASLGQEVYAVVDGVLTRQAGADSSLSGNAWGLTSSDGTYYFYAHLSAFAEGLAVGSPVRQGQVIGYVGDTGNPGAGNYHLHFEIHPGGQTNPAVDPFPLLEIPTACTIY